MRRAKRGDIFAVNTPRGWLSFQYVLKQAELGHLIRVLPGFFDDQEAVPDSVVEREELFFVFFPLQAALNRGLVHFAFSAQIPLWAQNLPKMRRPGVIAENGKVENWIISDGQSEYVVRGLTEEHARLSPAEIWNDTILIERVCEGWVPICDLNDSASGAADLHNS